MSPTKKTDIESLVSAAQSGSGEAINALVHAMRPTVEMIAMKYIHSPLEKDDLVLVGVATATRRSFAVESVLGKLRGDLWRLGQEAGVLEPFPKMRDAETPLRFLWVDAFPLCIKSQDVDEIVETMRSAGLTVEEKGSYFLERYWFNLYSIPF